MATRAQLATDVADWLNRQDFGDRIDTWIRLAESDIAELLRARSMIATVDQPIDAPLINLPTDFLEMDSIRDSASGKRLSLEDHWTGPLKSKGGAVTAYRLVGNCIEFLPWPTIVPGQPFAQITMVYFALPPPLLDPQDSNVVLEQNYAVYLFGTCRYAAKWALDAARAEEVEKDLTEAIGAANAWKEKTDYSGAPLRAVVGFWR